MADITIFAARFCAVEAAHPLTLAIDKDRPVYFRVLGESNDALDLAEQSAG